MSPDLLRRTEMKSKAGAQCGSAPPRPPKERASRERQPTETTYTAEKVSVFEAKSVSLQAARHDSDFAFPFEGCEAGAW